MSVSDTSSMQGAASTVGSHVERLVPHNHLHGRAARPARRAAARRRAVVPGLCDRRRGQRAARGRTRGRQVARLFDELLLLLESGQHLDVTRSSAPSTWCATTSGPPRCYGGDPALGQGPFGPAQDRGQKRYADAIRDNIVTFGIGPAGTGKSYLAVALAVQALQAEQVDRIILTRPAVEAGERLGFLPGDLMAKVDPYLRPLYDALYDMLGPRAAQRLLDDGHRRGRPPRLHARPHPQRLVHHPRRGAEHHPRADEDVPDADRLRLEGASSPAT